MLAIAGTVTKRPDKVASQATICPALSLSCAEIDRCPHVIFSSAVYTPLADCPWQGLQILRVASSRPGVDFSGPSPTFHLDVSSFSATVTCRQLETALGGHMTAPSTPEVNCFALAFLFCSFTIASLWCPPCGRYSPWSVSLSQQLLLPAVLAHFWPRYVQGQCQC